MQTRRLLAEDVADCIREEILAGRLSQGERLVEAAIAKELGVSRGPVREALKLLRGEGLVSEEPHRGAFVARFTSADVRDIFDLRVALEVRVARQVAARHTPSDIRTLRQLLGQLAEASEHGDPEQLLQADAAFHEGVCRLARNRRVLEVYARYVPVVKNLLRIQGFTGLYHHDAVLAHEPLVQAIEAGDADLATVRFREHAERTRDLLVARIDGLPAHA